MATPTRNESEPTETRPPTYHGHSDASTQTAPVITTQLAALFEQVTETIRPLFTDEASPTHGHSETAPVITPQLAALFEKVTETMRPLFTGEVPPTCTHGHHSDASNQTAPVITPQLAALLEQVTEMMKPLFTGEVPPVGFVSVPV